MVGNSHTPAPAGPDPVLRGITRVLGAIAAALVFAMMCVTCADVFGRYVLNQPLPGAFEITEVMLALVIFVALPIVCLEDGHITVSLVSERLGPRARAVQGFVVALFSASILGVVAWQLLRHGVQLASYGDVTVFLRIPKGPIAFVLAALTMLAGAALLVLAIRLFRNRAPSPADNPHA